MNAFSKDMSKEVPQISEQAMAISANYDWPGNVRQLQNVVQRLILCGDHNIKENQVQIALGIGTPESRGRDLQTEIWMDRDFMLTWRDMELKIKEKYFRFVRDNSASDAEAARKLGLAPPNYYRMCKEMGIK